MALGAMIFGSMTRNTTPGHKKPISAVVREQMRLPFPSMGKVMLAPALTKLEHSPAIFGSTTQRLIHGCRKPISKAVAGRTRSALPLAALAMLELAAIPQ